MSPCSVDGCDDDGSSVSSSRRGNEDALRSVGRGEQRVNYAQYTRVALTCLQVVPVRIDSRWREMAARVMFQVQLRSRSSIREFCQNAIRPIRHAAGYTAQH